MPFRVFISYRRRDQPALAQWLRQKIASELNGEEVFLDAKDIESGDRFPDRIQRAIDSSSVFVALIGPQWNPPLPAGGRRLDRPDDFVRREVALGLERAEGDPMRLVLPVLFDGCTMPDPAELPGDVRPLTDFQALSLPAGAYQEVVQGVAQRVLARLDELDTTPREERWVTEQIALDLLPLGSARIVELGRELNRRFKTVQTAPESARALARVIYRIGPPALQYLIATGKPHEQLESLLELLATNWINPKAAAALRNHFGNVPLGRGKKVAIECDFAAFTPTESLLKASRWEDGWQSLTVKASETAEEIIQQIHETLLQVFEKSLNAEMTQTPKSCSAKAGVHRERVEILERLKQRNIEEGGVRFPFVLHANHRMAMDEKLIKLVQAAFPPLHVLVATNDAEEVTKTVGGFADVVTPSDNTEDERHAYAAYASAYEIIADRKRRRS
jgi:hypothetical protein